MIAIRIAPEIKNTYKRSPVCCALVAVIKVITDGMPTIITSFNMTILLALSLFRIQSGTGLHKALLPVMKFSRMITSATTNKT
jgi:hypothetical protein